MLDTVQQTPTERAGLMEVLHTSLYSTIHVVIPPRQFYFNYAFTRPVRHCQCEARIIKVINTWLE